MMSVVWLSKNTFVYIYKPIFKFITRINAYVFQMRINIVLRHYYQIGILFGWLRMENVIENWMEKYSEL